MITYMMTNLNQQTNSNEFLLNNFIEKDIQDMLRPINFLTSTYLLPKYKIRNNFVTTNSFSEISLAFCAT